MKQLLIGCLLLCNLFGYGQDDLPVRSKDTYLSIGIGLSGMKSRDRLVMPRRYEGTNFAFSLGFQRLKARSQQAFRWQFAVGGLSAERLPIEEPGMARFQPPRAALYYTQLEYTWMHHLKVIGEKYTWLIGASTYGLLNVRSSTRWDNSLINYEGSLAPLAFVTRLQRDLTIRKKAMQLGGKLRVPLITYVMRPAFSGVPDFLAHEDGFFDQFIDAGNSAWTGPWEFPHIETAIDLSMPIRGENVLQFSYRWEYYSYQDPVPTRFANHTYLITLNTKI